MNKLTVTALNIVNIFIIKGSKGKEMLLITIEGLVADPLCPQLVFFGNVELVSAYFTVAVIVKYKLLVTM